MLRYQVKRKIIKDKKKIQKFIKKEQIEKYFREAFRDIHKKFEKSSNDYELSGSCAVCILIIDYRMYCINLGDSRAVIGSRKGLKKSAIEMSIDHKPKRDDEERRINEKGGEVSDKLSGVTRVFKKNDELPGLAVSRSIGDTIAHECGVISDPEVIEKDLDMEDIFVVIASDGVWDAMNNAEVVGFIFDKMETKKELVAKLLVEECRNRWEILNLFKQKYILETVQSKEGSNSNKSKDVFQNVLDIDDITAAIHFFNLDF
jgi:serine/threonine protein phosphatase PrpC